MSGRLSVVEGEEKKKSKTKDRRGRGGCLGFKSGWSEGDEKNLWLRLSVSEGELPRERLSVSSFLRGKRRKF